MDSGSSSEKSRPEKEPEEAENIKPSDMLSDISSLDIDKIAKKALEESRRELDGALMKGMEVKGRGGGLFEKWIKRIEAQNPRQTELIQNYLDAVKEVKANGTLTPREILKKLLTPLIEGNKIYFFPNSHQFIDDEEIDLNSEFDTTVLTCDPRKYVILGDGTFDRLRILHTRSDIIGLTDGYNLYLAYCRDVRPISESEFENLKERDPNMEQTLRPGSSRKSISEIYKAWLPTLNQELMKSKDLLTQILACYTIKRALNQDQEAIHKLYSLYETKAILIAKSFTTQKGMERFFPDIKNDAKDILGQIISGFSPAAVMDSLANGRVFVIPVQLRIAKFYIWYYSEFVPDYIQRNFVVEAARTALFQNYLSDIAVYLNPYAPIYSTTRWIMAGGRCNRFNSYSFIPTRTTNLTIWLFGTKNNPLQGRYCQLVWELVKKYHKGQVNTSRLKRRMKRGVRNETRRRATISDEILAEVEIKLLKSGVFKNNTVRNVEIVLKRLERVPIKKIAEEFHISVRQVINILNMAKRFSKSDG